MNILIIGSGGREHALALSLAADPSVGALHVAPGNAGTAQVATNHAVNATDADDVVALAERVAADLVVIGPEAPLVAGVADAVRDAGRLPTLSVAISLVGVIERKNDTNRSSP